MKTLQSILRAGSAALTLVLTAPVAKAAEPVAIQQKLNPYIECTNRLSERAYQSRARYFSWVGKNGPTGKERIIYGTYTIYDSAPCKAKVEAAATAEPRDADLESAGAAYAKAVTTLEPLLKEADDYYDQKNYKDDKMAKGRALHPQLIAAWNEFAAADTKLRGRIEVLGDQAAIEKLALIERTEGKSGRWHVETLMMKAKRLLRAEQQTDKPDLPKITAALGEYEAIVKEAEAYAPTGSGKKIDSSLISNAKSYLTTAKSLMRRIRDKEPYSAGDRMMLSSQGAGWMVEGSPARLTRDYNQLVDSYNRGRLF